MRRGAWTCLCVPSPNPTKPARPPRPRSCCWWCPALGGSSDRLSFFWSPHTAPVLGPRSGSTSSSPGSTLPPLFTPTWRTPLSPGSGVPSPSLGPGTRGGTAARRGRGDSDRPCVQTPGGGTRVHLTFPPTEPLQSRRSRRSPTLPALTAQTPGGAEAERGAWGDALWPFTHSQAAG